MDPGLEQERLTLRSVGLKQHVAACPFLRTGWHVVLPTCAQGSSVSAMEFVEKGAAWGLLVLLVVLLILGVFSFANLPTCMCGT